MAKNIVICCDGTGNEIGTTISNVLKLYRILEKSPRQRVFYNPGVGTIGQQNAWQRFRQRARGVFGLATGYGLDDDVLGAYRFLSQVYEEGDRIWLFGFSRGAYTVRTLAAFLHVIGLLRPDQLNLAGFAFTAYKRTSEVWGRELADPDGLGPGALQAKGKRARALEAAWHFSRVAGAAPVGIEFIGVWDTVASVIVPRKDRILPGPQTLRFTRKNPSVKRFRQAIAIDERRRMFRLNHWRESQAFKLDPFNPATWVAQDIQQVWFAGVHADIGGGYPEVESGLSKFPLAWMVEEAHAYGLHTDRSMINHLIYGRPREGSKHSYTPPDPKGYLHNSMTAGWKPLELLPKRVRWREWPKRRAAFGWYLPLCEPRIMPVNALVHQSVQLRMEADASYRPVNLVEPYRLVKTRDTEHAQLLPHAS